jgi:hypothetical protein
MTGSSRDLNAKAIPQWTDIDSRPFRTSALRYRSVGFGLLAVWLGHICLVAFGDWSGIVTFLLINLVFFLATTSVMVASDVFEDKAKAAELLNSIRSGLRSERKYILLLRSFTSKLVSETTYRVRTVEREEVRLIRGDLYPTGRKYKAYEHGKAKTDDISNFLSSAAHELTIVIITGNAYSLSDKPFCILSSDDQWWSVFGELKAGAQLIAVAPEPSKSLTEEIRAIVGEVLDKSIFIMPPSRTFDLGTGGDTWVSGLTRRDRWADAIAGLPITLPDYSEEGAILRFSHVGARASILPYKRETIMSLLEEHYCEGIPLGRAVQELYSKDLLTPMLLELEIRASRFNP